MMLLIGGVFLLDQVSKKAVMSYLEFPDERVVIAGFFSLVHWRNTGAAWGMFHDKNLVLAVVDLLALAVLFLSRHRLYVQTRLGATALGLMFGGILGNLTDRLLRGHVIDLLYFYVRRRTENGGQVDMGYPAFNVADAAICTGVGLLFLLSLRREPQNPATPVPQRPAVPQDASVAEPRAARPESLEPHG